MPYCKICGKPNCKEHTFLIPKSIKISEFAGSSPPEVFVGHYNYPKVNIGILSPQTYGDNQILSSPEEWHKQNLSKYQIVALRNQLIYGRTKSHIALGKTQLGRVGGTSSYNLPPKFLQTMQETAMTHKSLSTEFKLKNSISANKNLQEDFYTPTGITPSLLNKSQNIGFSWSNKEHDSRTPLISNAAQVRNIRLQENPKIKPKVDYITSDTDAKSVTGMLELEKSGLDSSHIIKILSTGLLGLKTKRRLVPTRWSITAVDDTLSKNKLKRIRYYPEISEILLFHSEYLGNHYEFLLLPDKFSFEVIEIALNSNQIWKDYEGFFPRKKYAHEVTGAYYANRLALTEYLERVHRQASCLVIREIRPEYNIPLGVGILRQASRHAFTQKPEKPETLKEALGMIQSRLKQPVENYTSNSTILKEYGKQRRLGEWF